MSREEDIEKAASELIESLTYDDSGKNGRGGNGGLISRETIRKADTLRLMLGRTKGRP